MNGTEGAGQSPAAKGGVTIVTQTRVRPRAPMPSPAGKRRLAPSSLAFPASSSRR
jgi:hypothetical protein